MDDEERDFWKAAYIASLAANHDNEKASAIALIAVDDMRRVFPRPAVDDPFPEAGK